MKDDLRARPHAQDTRMDADLRAFAEVTARGLPTLGDTERALHARLQQTEAGISAGRGGYMETLQRMRRHPRLLTSLCAGAVAAGLLVMPVSYQHTVGHRVKITISSQRGGQDPTQVARLARQVRSALHAQGLQVEAEPGTLTLTALLSTRSRAEVQHRADALVKGLAHEHLSAQAQVTPRTELVAGRVYAMALDKVIEIRVDLAGKSAAQIEDEIREQLERQGVADAEVKVQREGDETSVRIGGEIGDRNVLIENRQVGGPQQIEMRIGDLDTRREPGMTDEQLREKIERQLRARGLEPQVTVQGEKVRIEARKRVEAP